MASPKTECVLVGGFIWKNLSQEFASCSSQRPTWAQHLNFGSDTRMEKVVGSHWTLCRLSFDTGRIRHITWIMLKAIILCLSARLFSLHLSATNPWSLLITPVFTGYFRKLFLCWQLSLAWPEHTSADIFCRFLTKQICWFWHRLGPMYQTRSLGWLGKNI